MASLPSKMVFQCACFIGCEPIPCPLDRNFWRRCCRRNWGRVGTSNHRTGTDGDENFIWENRAQVSEHNVPAEFTRLRFDNVTTPSRYPFNTQMHFKGDLSGPKN
jgi:hypothetical protein